MTKLELKLRLHMIAKVLSESLDVKILDRGYKSLITLINQIDKMQPDLKPLEWTDEQERDGDHMVSWVQSKTILGDFIIGGGLIKLLDNSNETTLWEQACVGLRDSDAKELAENHYQTTIRSTLV